MRGAKAKKLRREQKEAIGKLTDEKYYIKPNGQVVANNFRQNYKKRKAGL